VVTLLAASSIGAIFSSAAADFGVDGVLERLLQIRPKLLIVTNGVVYAETPRPLLPLLPTLLSSLDTPPLKTAIVDHLPHSMVAVPGALDAERVVRWDKWLDRSGGEVEFLRMGFNEPIWILFSSGTTGKSWGLPKCNH
jgi:acetoacetyl-CoA synthetase